jgi:hypothetical protein
MQQVDKLGPAYRTSPCRVEPCLVSEACRPRFVLAVPAASAGRRRMGTKRWQTFPGPGLAIRLSPKHRLFPSDSFQESNEQGDLPEDEVERPVEDRSLHAR